MRVLGKSGGGWRLARAGLVVLGAIFLMVVAGVGVLEMGVRAVGGYVDFGLRAPSTECLKDASGRIFFVRGNDRARDCRPLRLDEMGEWLPRVTVGLEDRRFFEHRGFDWWAAGGAALRNFYAGRKVSGASTITQQVVKMGLGRVGRAGWQEKAWEALLALGLERRMGKREILEAYINRLDYGNRRIGPEAAAQAYFGKRARDLSLAEAIYLAGLPRSPGLRNPWRWRAGADELYVRNVRRLGRLRLLPEGVDVDVLAGSVPKVGRFEAPARAWQFAEVALRSGVVETCLDGELQAVVEGLLRGYFSRWGDMRDGVVVVVENATSRVRALAATGGLGGINLALQGREAGSALKPFLYAEALDGGRFTAASWLPDDPDVLGRVYSDYAPRNFARNFLGRVRLRQALGNSLNLPAVWVVARLGARGTFAELREWGLDMRGNFDERGAGFVLGNVEVSPLGMACGYAALARGGLVGSLVWSDSETGGGFGRVLSEGAARVVEDILADPEARVYAFGLMSVLNLGWRAAVKTGTSSGFRDGWCAGYDRDHTVVVWVGHRDGRPMPGVLAVRSAAPLWAEVMSVLRARGSRALPEMEEYNVAERRWVWRQAGERVLGGGSGDCFEEWFIPGTGPSDGAGDWEQGDEGGIMIRYPRDGQEFIFEPRLAGGRQVIVALSDRGGVIWKLNGRECVGGRIPLMVGDHVLRAECDGETAEVRFRVLWGGY